MTQKSCHKCCQLVLTNMIMVNNYTKIKLNIGPTPLHTIRSKRDVIPKVWRHVAQYVIGCAWKTARIYSQDKFDIFRGHNFIDLTFSLDSNLVVHPPYNPDLIFPPVTFGFFSELKERLAGRKFTRVQDLSKAVRHFRDQRYTSFGVPVCSSDVAEAARNVCDQWRDVRTLKAYISLLEVCSLVSVLPHLTLPKTFGLALVHTYISWLERLLHQPLVLVRLVIASLRSLFHVLSEPWKIKLTLIASRKNAFLIF